MIFGNLINLESYNYLPELVKEALIHAKNNNVIEFEPGTHEIKVKSYSLIELITLQKIKKIVFGRSQEIYRCSCCF